MNIHWNRAYNEYSGKTFHFITTQLGDKFLKQITIHPSKVMKILPNKEIKSIDDFKYKRNIGGKWVEKIMIGTPGLKIK